TNIEEMVALAQIKIYDVTVHHRRVRTELGRPRLERLGVDLGLRRDHDHTAAVALDVEHRKIARPLDAPAIAKALAPARAVAGHRRVGRADERGVWREAELAL